MTEEQIRAATERDLQAKAYNEQLLKSLPTEELHRQFDALTAKLDGSRAKREHRGATKIRVKFPGSSGLLIDDKIAPE